MEALLIQLTYYILMLGALLSAVSSGIAAINGIRPRWFWLKCVGFIAIAIGMGLVVVNTGPAPAATRDMLRPLIRVLFAVGGVLWVIWGFLYLFTVVRVETKEREQKPPQKLEQED